MIRLLHTADVHMGRVVSQFGGLGAQLRQQIKATFQRLIEVAGRERVDEVLLTGDIFDSDKIAQADIQFFMDTVSSIQPIPAQISVDRTDLFLSRHCSLLRRQGANAV